VINILNLFYSFKKPILEFSMKSNHLKSHLNHLALMTLIILINYGCVSSSPSNPYSISDDNIFYSPRMPELNLNIDKQMEFVGSTSNYKAQKASDRNIMLPENSDAHVFVEAGSEGKIKRCLVISTSHLTKDRSYYKPDLLGKAEYYDYLNKKDIHGTRYIHAITRTQTSNLIQDYINLFIAEKNLQLPNYSVMNIYAKRYGTKSNYYVKILYLEDKNIVTKYDDKNKTIKYMMENIDNYIEFLN